MSNDGNNNISATILGLIILGTVFGLRSCIENHNLESDKKTFTEAVKKERDSILRNRFYFNFPDRFNGSGIDPTNLQEVANLLGVKLTNDPNQIIYEFTVSQPAADDNSLREKAKSTIQVTASQVKFYGNLMLIEQSIQFEQNNKHAGNYINRLNSEEQQTANVR